MATVAEAAGVKTNIREMRHFNATQLVSDGVDLRTAAARLGCGNGGATTMRVYAHRTPPSDRRAARVATLADWYRVSKNTAHRALKLLAQDGLITVRRGARSAVAPR